MRPNIPTCLITGDQSHLHTEIIASLSYSTHCRYTLMQKMENNTLSPHLTIKEKVENNEQFDFALSINNKKVVFKKFRNPTSISKLSLLKISDTKVESEIEEPFTAMRSYKEWCYDAFSVYLMYDFEANIVSIGVIGYQGSKFCVLDHQNDFSKTLLILILRKIRSKLLPDFSKIIKVSIKRNGNSLHLIFPDVIDFLEVRLLRACGINLGLIMIQDLYQRRVRTYRFVVARQSIKEKFPKLDLNYSRVYYDLDETLVWEGKPLKQGTDYLMKFVEFGSEVNLITRHTYDIHQTLINAGIDPKVFTNILKVKKNEKKSFYMTEKSILIDNEFSERLDTYLNVRAVPLNIDQLEFLSFQGYLSKIEKKYAHKR